MFIPDLVFIGPESDHWLCLSVTHSLTDSCLVSLIDVILACENANSKLVEVVSLLMLVMRMGWQQFVADLESSDFEPPAWSRF